MPVTILLTAHDFPARISKPRCSVPTG
jgi:hypothetical protein